MEFRFLQFFDWHISFPTSAHFFDYFFVDGMADADLSLWGSVGFEKAKLYLTKYAIYFLEISLQGTLQALSVFNCFPVLKKY